MLVLFYPVCNKKANKNIKDKKNFLDCFEKERITGGFFKFSIGITVDKIYLFFF
jgi:hypothetical protein